MADERGTETNYVPKTGEVYNRETRNYGGSGNSIATAVDERQKSQRSLLAAAADRAKKKTPMPSQQEGESPAAYGDRVRKWRAGE